MPVCGIGLGLRWQLAPDLLRRAPPELAFIEVAPENYMRRGGRFSATLAACIARWPVVTHGLTMSLGGADPLATDYLRTLRSFLRDVGSPWHSDHLCFGIVEGTALHELLPLPLTQEAAEHVAARTRQAQDTLDVPFAVENISSYALLGRPEMDEADFAALVVEKADCGLLLDVNNVYVNSKNDDSDPNLVIDTHAEAVKDDVYDLLAFALARTGPVPVLLERDDNFPSFDELSEEILRLHRIYQSCEVGAGVER
jgi:uncharacterized protein (UPF0276 family)